MITCPKCSCCTAVVLVPGELQINFTGSFKLKPTLIISIVIIKAKAPWHEIRRRRSQIKLQSPIAGAQIGLVHIIKQPRIRKHYLATARIVIAYATAAACCYAAGAAARANASMDLWWWWWKWWKWCRFRILEASGESKET
ncbi:unnamed protein product [Linum tenue]|uniref:Uncharacterized protein n=1 Tax=Linum tenue TaxID=586396 RepID=A0AAV0HIV4_9ROSI|nr:unnamed protein product [Linum tenue]